MNFTCDSLKLMHIWKKALLEGGKGEKKIKGCGFLMLIFKLCMFL